MYPNAKVMTLMVDDPMIEVEEKLAPPIYDEEPDGVAKEDIENVKVEFNLLEVSKGRKFSFNQLKENGGERSLKFEGHICRFPIQILVDSGAHLNFISTSLAEYLQLPATRVNQPLKITTGSGHALICDTEYDEVPIVIQGILFHVSLPWLELVSPLLMDCKELSVKF